MTNSHDYILHLAKNHTPSLRYDGKSDFSQWQSTARAKLSALLKMPTALVNDEFHMDAETSFPDYTRYDFKFQTEPDYFASASFLLPKSCKEKTPTVICLQGHSTGMHISLGESVYHGDAESIAGGRDFALQAVANGYCAVTLDQRYMGSAGHDEAGEPACLSENEGMATLLMGRTAIGERVWDISRLIDVITGHFSGYVDENRIVCLGNSGGGTATFYASIMDERICVSVPSCAVCSFDKSIMAMWHCPCNFIPDIRNYFDMGDLGMLIAPKKLIVVCGKEDDIFPLDGVHESFAQIKSAYALLGKEDICTLVEGDGGHRFYPEQTWEIIKKYLED